jgi:hypothetical protein
MSAIAQGLGGVTACLVPPTAAFGTVTSCAKGATVTGDRRYRAFCTQAFEMEPCKPCTLSLVTVAPLAQPVTVLLCRRHKARSDSPHSQIFIILAAIPNQKHNDMIKRGITFFLVALFLLIQGALYAGEGMWLPFLLKQLNEKEMQAMGMKMTAEDIYSINQGSLKDAIVHFGGFCTSEIISPEGLLLTNHHCGYGAIQEHSTLENNLLENGFWAENKAAEIPNSGLTATLIVRMEDVTGLVLANVTEEMDAAARQSAIDKAINEITSNTAKEDYQDATVRSFFEGNQYIMFVTVTYRDVRLVGAPPSSIGKFGADTDNWVWPRHTGDFSLFRIYADENNLPADYSPDNKPYRPKHFLPISLDGVEEDDFTLIFGFPGRTQEYLPSMAVRQVMNTVDPARIGVRDQSLAVIDKYMRADPEIKIQYASKFASLANGWKKWIGEKQGLESVNAVGKKEKYEAEFSELLANHGPFQDEYGHLLPSFKQLYNEIEPYAEASTYYSEVTGRNIELFRIAAAINRLLGTYESSGDAGYEDYAARLLPALEGFYKDYRAEVDQDVFAAVMAYFMKQVDPKFQPESLPEILKRYDGDYSSWAAELYGNSALTDYSSLQAMVAQEDIEAAVEALKSDPAVQLAQLLIETNNELIAPTYTQLNEQIKELQTTYMRAQMEVFKDRRFYPDANGTMRVTYGQVAGYTPRDAVQYEPVTYLEGVMEKYVPGDYEFDVHDKLQDLYRRKDYGDYADANGKMPVCFIGSNHTTGGNSGSPAIDAHGNLIGLNFDRAWEGTMSDINYDATICRNIMVDARYILFIIDKFAGASHLIEEMKLVHPKKGK